jgi:hypothetical protein
LQLKNIQNKEIFAIKNSKTKTVWQSRNRQHNDNLAIKEKTKQRQLGEKRLDKTEIAWQLKNKQKKDSLANKDSLAIKE